MSVGVLLLLSVHISRRKAGKRSEVLDGYAQAKEETLQKIPRRKQEIDSPDWAPQREEEPDWSPHSPRSVDIKKSLSRVKSLIKSRSKRVEDDDNEEPLVIIDRTH
jgi:hypothetical protein